MIAQQLLKQCVSIPTGENLTAVVTGFEDTWGFPQFAEAIGGSHIPIQAPGECPKDYYNRKGHHSILLQALLDHRYCFMHINIVWPGCVNDAHVLAKFELCQRGQMEVLFPEQPKQIKGVSVPLLNLGDPAYLLLPWILKPYTDTGTLSLKQSVFNY